MANNHSSNCPNYRHFTMTRALRNPLDLTTSLAPLPLPPLLLLLRFLLLLVCSTLSDELPVPPSEWRLQFVYTNFMVTSFSSASCWPTSSTFLCLSLCLCLPCSHSAWQLLASEWVELRRVEFALKTASKCPNCRLLCDLSCCSRGDCDCDCPRLTPKTMQQLT